MPEDTTPAPRNVADTVRLSARRHGDAPALVTDAQVLTWGELDALVDAVAAGLRRLDLPTSAGAPARVAIALPQVPEFASAFFGTLRAGLVALPVNPGYTPRELRHVLGDSGATVLVTVGQVAAAVETIRADLPGLRHLFTLDPFSGARPFSELSTPAAPLPATGGDEDLAVVIYTSGTSGSPKGAMLAHRALLANQRQAAAVSPPVILPGDVVLLSLPFLHIFGLNAGLVATAYHGATGVLLGEFDPARSLDAIERHGVTVVAAVPQMYGAWLDQPRLASAFSGVRVAVSGGAPLSAVVAQQFRDITGRPVHQGYGLTETAPVLTLGLCSPVPKAGSVGRPLPGVQAKLVGTDGSVIAELATEGRVDRRHAPAPELGFTDDDPFESDATDPGQIVVRGENLFLGYWPDRQGGPDADGWWATGDVGYADADGDLVLVDRLEEIVIVNGFNVYPREVEQVLATHPLVAEAAVVGVPDVVTGEAVHAYVVPAGASVAIEELHHHCGQNLARYKRPATFEIVAALPHSVIGKVRKGTLRPEAVS